MEISQLSHLALLHIHYDILVDLDKVVDRYTLNWNLFCTEFQLCLMKFVLFMVLITLTLFIRMTTIVVMNIGTLITNDDYSRHGHHRVVSALYPAAM